MKNYNLDFISELNPRRVGLEGVPREYDMWLFFRYSNKDLVHDMASGTFLFPVVTKGASQLFIAPHQGRCTESTSQDSREEPPKVISKPCDAGSVKHIDSDAENVNSPISKADEGVILSKSSIADESTAKGPNRPGTSSHKHSQPKRQDQTGTSTRIQGTDDKENKPMQKSLAPVSGEVSYSDDDLAFAIKETKRPAVKKLPFSNSPVKSNALVVMKSKGDIHKPRYDLISNMKQQGLVTTSFAWTMHRTRVRCMVTCECGA